MSPDQALDALDAPVSKRTEPCGHCGDPLFVCPATIRRFVRCCDHCTHMTDNDRSWPAVRHPAAPAAPIPQTPDQALLEAM